MGKRKSELVLGLTVTVIRGEFGKKEKEMVEENIMNYCSGSDISKNSQWIV